MAGIGFKLRELLEKDTFFNTLAAYGIAGITSSGPWILSILGIFFVGLICRAYALPALLVQNFQTVVVYLFAASLIFSAVFQHTFTRHIANIVFSKDFKEILPSFNSALLIMLLICVIFGLPSIFLLFPQETLLFKSLLLTTFIILSLTWISTSTLFGLRIYKIILLSFFICTVVTVVSSFFLKKYLLTGLLASFLLGQFILLFGLIFIVYKFYPSKTLLNFNFFTFKNNKKMLILTGLLYNLGVWADKFIYWYNPMTGQPGFGPLHFSLIYDLPIFLAYLTVIPGMAVFLLKIETDFIDDYQKFYDRVCHGGTLEEIDYSRYSLVLMARDCVFSIIKFQIIVMLICLGAGSVIFNFLGVSSLYLPIFFILVMAASLNVVFWALLDIVFYLDETKQAVILTATFLLTNILFTWLSIHWGVYYYGYGLLFSLLISNVVGFVVLRKNFTLLEYSTFMLQS